MQRLSRILVALGGAMSVACSAEPTVAPTIGTKPVSRAADPKLLEISTMAHAYLKNLNDRTAGNALTDAQRNERIEHVARFVQAVDGSIRTPETAELRIAPENADHGALAEEAPTPESESGSTAWIDVFVDAGTFTDLCLPCQTANGFVETRYLGLLTSSTSALINVGGAMYNPSSGNWNCIGFACSSVVDLRPIVDCWQRPASGTASSTAIYFTKAKLFNLNLFFKDTYARGECVPPQPPTVSLGSSSISVGASTQATSNCVGYVQWSSGNPGVASVDSYGAVTGNRSGSAEIAATCNGMRGSAVIEVHMAEEQTSGGACDDLMTPAVEDCDDPGTQTPDLYSTTYTRPGSYGEGDASWFTEPEYTQTYTVYCDVTDWYQWNADHTESYYLGTDINYCWLVPYNGGH